LNRLFAQCLFAAALGFWLAGPVRASDCPTPDDPISTDRPDVTNSSSVVPVESLQIENGIDGSTDHGSLGASGTNTRVRLGTSQCNEVLVDLPTYNFSSAKDAPIGFSDISPAFKHQFTDLPSEATISGVLGLNLPIGARRLAGRGSALYAQTSWSYELAEDWAVNGMETVSWFPADAARRTSGQSSISLERGLDSRSDAFIEYIADFGHGSAAVSRFNAGAAYRLTPTSQIDFHVGAGLDRHAPSGFIGIGYSFRFDRFSANWR